MFQKIFIRNFFDVSNDNPSIIKKNITHQSKNILDEEFYDSIIYINILNKHFFVKTLTKEIVLYNHVVCQGDVLAKILLKNSSGIDFSKIIFLIKKYPVLKNLQKGQILSWVVVRDKILRSLIWRFSFHEIRIYNCAYTKFSEGIVRIIDRWDDRLSNKILFIGKLNGTFFDSARCLGIEENYITDIFDNLRHQLNFKKLRQGDEFSVLTSIKIGTDYSIQTKFLGARLHTVGKDYYVFRANNGYYYDNKAVRLKNNFIRFPISKPFRISSNFNLHRLNPITRQISPHVGVDFAIPIGTPVLSVGDGEVIISEYNKVAGNYIVIKHNYRRITRYMHLKKLLVKSGQKVKCGDNIALSGNTGRSTGPHLHFEIWIDCRPVNPLTVNLLNTDKLLGSDRVVYLNQINKIIPNLRLH